VTRSYQPLVWFLVLGGVALACQDVAEVLHAPSEVALAGAGAQAAAGSAGLGGGGTGGASIVTAGEAGESGLAAPDPALGAFVDGGDAHGCATRFGILYCWGSNGSGRLGFADELGRSRPTRVGKDADWISVATGVAHTCAVKVDGSVWCFGANDRGQLGQGAAQATLLASAEPLLVPLPGKALSLSSQSDTACAVLESGELYCWGNNYEGNIGLGDVHPGADQWSPVRVSDFTDWTQIGTGQGHTCAVRSPGLLFGWGRNTAGNLGLGQKAEDQRRSPTQIGVEQDWLSVVAGQDASCGLRAGGRLFCWGGNSFATLGLGDREERLSPTEVAPPAPGDSWRGASLDTFHACGVASDGALYCWGRNLEGQLGTDDNDDRLGPARVGSDFVQVAVGRFFSCAVTSDARIACTGANDAGQLGLGDNTRRKTFTDLTFP
jgi:alpha-tubulin suppressor-like RCC1 family protein